MGVDHQPVPRFPIATVQPEEPPALWLARLARRLAQHAARLLYEQRTDGAPALVCLLPALPPHTIWVQLVALTDQVQVEVWHGAWADRTHLQPGEYTTLVHLVISFLLDQICVPSDPAVRLAIEPVDGPDDGVWLRGTPQS